ncbi:MAG: hypothetical protein JNK15_12095 [Planctomycetes bacterium]|nr:hypothetical protein [Planctomycetota bacterium]
MASRAQRMQSELRHRLATEGPAAFGSSQVFSLVLALLTIVMVGLFFRGQAPAALEKVFAQQGQEVQPKPPVDPAERRRLVAEKLHGAWHDVPDGSDFTESEGYRKLVSTLIDHVRPGDVVENPPPFDRAAAMRTPELLRSDTFVVSGVVADHRAMKLDSKVFQLGDVWRVFVTDWEGDNAVVVDVVEQPPPLDFRRDRVEIDAQFYRLVTYASETARPTIPYLIARSVRVVPGQKRSLFDLSDPMNLIMVITLGTVVLWAVVRIVSSRKAPRAQWRAPRTL